MSRRHFSGVPAVICLSLWARADVFQSKLTSYIVCITTGGGSEMIGRPMKE